jgi:hypothetical protein
MMTRVSLVRIRAIRCEPVRGVGALTGSFSLCRPVRRGVGAVCVCAEAAQVGSVPPGGEQQGEPFGALRRTRQLHRSGLKFTAGKQPSAGHHWSGDRSFSA